ncbi:hypothetical protein Tco_0260554 [Tanacetum coccineum]
MLSFTKLRDVLLDQREAQFQWACGYQSGTLRIPCGPSKIEAVKNWKPLELDLRREQGMPKRVRAMDMILQSSIKDRILAAQKEAAEEFTVFEGVSESSLIMDEAHSRSTRPTGLLQQLEIPVWKWEGIVMDFVMDRLTNVRCAPFKALYGRKFRSPIMWAEVGEDRQKSYAYKRRKPLEFSVREYVLLKVSPWKGVVCFGKKGKLAPRFVGPFEIIKRIGPMPYRLDLPKKLNGVHDTFHVSNHKKYLVDPILQVPLNEIRVDAKLNFVEEPVEILKRVQEA